MGKHMRKLFSDKEVKEIFERYLLREIGVEHAIAFLNSVGVSNCLKSQGV